MRSTFKQLYYINRSKVKTDGTTAIWCRITIDGKQAVLSTGIYCNPDDWNSKKGEVKDIRTNGRLSQYRQHIEDTYNSILKEQGVVSAEILKKYHSGGKLTAHHIVADWRTGTGTAEETLR